MMEDDSVVGRCVLFVRPDLTKVLKIEIDGQWGFAKNEINGQFPIRQSKVRSSYYMNK